jgi:CheY-like chemotaxis protein
MKKLRKLLLIDDEKVSRFLNGLVVDELYLVDQIVQCDNGQDALLKLEEESQKGLPLPDAIILDLYMPVMNGFEFLERLHASHELRTLLNQTIVFTSSVNSRDKEQVRKVGARWYLNKPMDRSDIFSVLVTLMQEHERQQLSHH